MEIGEETSNPQASHPIRESWILQLSQLSLDFLQFLTWGGDFRISQTDGNQKKQNAKAIETLRKGRTTIKMECKSYRKPQESYESYRNHASSLAAGLADWKSLLRFAQLLQFSLGLLQFLCCISIAFIVFLRFSVACAFYSNGSHQSVTS